MKRNPVHPGTYAGQPARIIVAAELTGGRVLLALKTAGGTVATAYDSACELRALAAEKHLVLEDERD